MDLSCKLFTGTASSDSMKSINLVIGEDNTGGGFETFLVARPGFSFSLRKRLFNLCLAACARAYVF